MSYEGGALGLLVAGGIAAAILAYNGAFYTTGTKWYEACWAKAQATKDWKEASAPDPYSDAIWQACDITTERAVYSEGLVFAGRAENVANAADLGLMAECPSNWTDVPVGGVYLLSVRMISESGGPTWFDAFVPAEMMLGRVWSAKWPRCNAERTVQGYPKIVEVSPGEFGWSERCVPCGE